eukprot:352749-Chlamydomonas_euryale.AAC.10
MRANSPVTPRGGLVRVVAWLVLRVSQQWSRTAHTPGHKHRGAACLPEAAGEVAGRAEHPAYGLHQPSITLTRASSPVRGSQPPPPQRARFSTAAIEGHPSLRRRL